MADIKSLPELFKVHEELRKALVQRMGTLRTPRLPTSEEAIALREADIEQAKAALAAAEDERKTIAAYWDDRVERLRARVARQGDEVAQAEALVKEGLKPAPAQKAPAKKTPAKKATAKRPLVKKAGKGGTRSE